LEKLDLLTCVRHNNKRHSKIKIHTRHI
jgi:hypothetical protein